MVSLEFLQYLQFGFVCSLGIYAPLGVVAPVDIVGPLGIVAPVGVAPMGVWSEFRDFTSLRNTP